MRLGKTNDEKQEKPPVAGFGCSSLCFYSISILFIYLSMLVHHSSNPVTDLPLLDRLDLFVAKIITPLTETRNRTPVYIADFCLSFHWRTSYLLTKGSRNSHVSCLQSYRTFSSNIHCAPWSWFFSLSKYGFDQNIPKGTKMNVC